MKVAQTSKNFHIHASSGKDDDSFVGIKAIGNDIYFFYPEAFSFDLNSEDWQKGVIAILSSIKIAKSLSSEKSSIYQRREKDNEFALNSYLWIIYDYLQHGFYVNKEKVYKHNQNGKINWKRTFQTNPAISNNQNVVYLDTISEAKDPTDNLMVEIHKVCVKKSILFIGWLFNLTASYIKTHPFSKEKKHEYIIALDEELEKTFDDEKKQRLIQMENVIKGLDSDDSNNNFVYGVDNYHYVFERMVDYVFNGKPNISDFYPKGKWKLVKLPQPIDSSNLRPDTIVIVNKEKGKDLYILDSKFYRFGITGFVSDLPETTSIQKQITYGEYIKKNIRIPFDHIYNAFILPYNKNKGPYKSEDDLQYIGEAYSTWKDKNCNNGRIYAFLIDLKHLVSCWYKHNRSQDIGKLVSKINELVSSQED
jgi:LlaJI restriction endonuclease.